MVFCQIPGLEGNNTTIYTIEKVCLAVPAGAGQKRGIYCYYNELYVI